MEMDDSISPEERLALRLYNAKVNQNLRDAMGKDALNNQVLELVKKLLEDPKFLQSLNKDPRFLESLRSHHGLFNDKLIQDLIRQGSLGGHLSEEDKKVIRDWASTQPNKPDLEKLLPPDRKGPDQPDQPDQPDKAERPADQAASPPSTPPHDSAPDWDRMPQEPPAWLRDNMKGFVNRLDRWVDSPSGKSWRDTLRDLARRGGASKWSPRISERANRLAGNLPRLGDYLPRRLRPTFGEPRVPSLPRLPSISTPSLPSGSGLSTVRPGHVLLWLVFGAVLLLLLWKSGSWYVRHQAQKRGGWRLGPWPVRPGAVRTRGDLVRAFEHLALLCLGPAARHRHHLDLADRLGKQPDVDPDRRRDAAGNLGQLYEKARYAPDDELLPAETMAEARRDLCFLAGVPAA
jgi:hypothetical protein